ncbi:MAG: hypothetical protein K6357_07660 [Elusimicrobiota bacterium]
MEVKKKLFICSFGLNPFNISYKTEEIIKQADIVISDVAEEKDFLWLNPKKFILPEKKEFDEKSLIKSIYLTIKKNLKKYKNIVFLTSGNPLFLNSIVEKIFWKFSRVASVIVEPSVSSFDFLIDKILRELKIVTRDITQYLNLKTYTL